MRRLRRLHRSTGSAGLGSHAIVTRRENALLINPADLEAAFTSERGSDQGLRVLASIIEVYKTKA